MYLLAPVSAAAVIIDLINLLVLLIFVDIIISWARMFGSRISSYHPVVRFVSRIVNPVLDPVRRIIPPYKTANWDLSPIIVILVLQWVARLLMPMTF